MTYNNKVMSFGATPKWMAFSSEPYMIFQFQSASFDPTTLSTWDPATHWTRVSTSPNCWKMTYDNYAWHNVLRDTTPSYYGTRSNFTDVPFSVIDADTRGVTDMYYMFHGCNMLTSVAPLQTSLVTDMTCMFTFCYALTTLPAMDTSNVTSMLQFIKQSGVTAIPQYNTHNVTTFGSFAEGCVDLVTVPLLDTSSATNLTYAFRYCNSLTSLPQFNTSNVTLMREMVAGCSSLVTFPALDTSKVGTGGEGSDTWEYAAWGLFENCSSLQTVPSIDLSHCSKLSHLFVNCYSLKQLPALDLSSATDIMYFCCNCENLETTAARYDIHNCWDINYMFAGCYKLKAIPELIVGSVAGCNSAFKDCYKAESGILAAYNALSSQETVPGHRMAFRYCGRDSASGRAELAQIPSDWK